MSTTTTKNILLSQPKAGQNTEIAQPTLAYNVSESEGLSVLTVELPGIDPSTVDVGYEAGYLLVDCSKGSLSHHLDPTVDTSKIDADILWGLLTIKIPAPKAPEPRSIKVHISDTVRKAASKTAQKAFTEDSES
jgi:HSP20 family molecular chaperone IbpA